MSKSAEFVKELTGCTGVAKLYRLSPPLIDMDYEDKERGSYEYVVVSATVAMFSGPETYIFPSDAKGKVTSYGELEGSYRGGLDHEAALRRAGYTVKEPA